MKRAVYGLVFACLPAVPANAADVAGTWALYAMDRGEITDATRLELAVNGNVISGKGRDFTVTGALKGDDLTLTALRANGQPLGVFEIHVTGANATGTMKRGENISQFTLHRLPPRATPRTVRFEPKTYHRLFGPAEPMLRINAGDTVRTTTLDSGGVDGNGKAQALGGNPQTGPIYVEGAIPGDTLAITINRIRLNRSTAHSGAVIEDVALTTEYASQIRRETRNVNGDWKLDVAGGTASLADPSDKLKDFKVALKPMIGGIGVAPARDEAFRTNQLGTYGGNLDYNGLTEGTTLYLPVAREGALLFVGDVHAAQGAGELTGDALETSAEIELTIDVRPGAMARGPLAENAEFLMSMGVAGSMEAATRLAVTQLAQWLSRDYGLSSYEAALVLGAAAQIEIAELVDPQVNIVAKVAKSVLAPLKRAPAP
jgi:acetamidase/formamidase